MTDQHPDDCATARAIVDANLYLTLATADAAGRPWATPVHFAPVAYRELLWVSRPGARHSANIAARPEVGIVVFDSGVPINHGVAVYMTGTAGLVPVEELDRCIEVFSRSCVARGGAPWSAEDVGPTAPLRLYRAVATEQWVLDPADRRVPLPLGLGSADPDATT